MKVDISDDNFQTPQGALAFCNKVKQRVPEIEALILQDAQSVVGYALDVIKGRWPAGEEILKTHPKSALYYAKVVIHGRFPEAEQGISKDPHAAEQYVRHVLGRNRSEGARWPEAEETIMQNPGAWDNYVRFVLQFGKVEPSDGLKWRWLRAGITEPLLGILNKAGMNQDMQEFVIQQRPDLITKIEKLKARLRKRYAHELELGRVDL